MLRLSTAGNTPRQLYFSLVALACCTRFSWTTRFPPLIVIVSSPVDHATPTFIVLVAYYTRCREKLITLKLFSSVKLPHVGVLKANVSAKKVKWSVLLCRTSLCKLKARLPRLGFVSTVSTCQNLQRHFTSCGTCHHLVACIHCTCGMFFHRRFQLTSNVTHPRVSWHSGCTRCALNLSTDYQLSSFSGYAHHVGSACDWHNGMTNTVTVSYFQTSVDACYTHKKGFTFVLATCDHPAWRKSCTQSTLITWRTKPSL